MAKDYTKILKSIENVVVVAVNAAGTADPTPVGVFPMVHSGFLTDGETKLNAAMNEFRESGGSIVQLGYDLNAVTKGLEFDPTEFAVAEKFEKATCDFFYFGRDQSHRLKNVTQVLSIEKDLGAKGKKLVSINGKKFAPSLAEILELNNSATFYSTNPAYKYNRIINKILRDKLELEAYPYLGNFGVAGSLYDASKNRFVGTVNGATQGSVHLIFDGINDDVAFGDILDDDGVGDFLIEVWVRIQGADASLQEILAKKNLSMDISAGFAIFRATTNIIQFRIADGTNTAVVGTASSVLLNVWKHFAIAVDRNGNATPYLNGVADGAPGSVAAVGSAANALNLFLGRDQTNFGQVDVGAARIYRFGAGGLPSNVAAIILEHFNAEKAEFGL